MKSRIAILAALLIAFYSVAGYLIVFDLSKKVIQARMMRFIDEGVHEEELVAFTFSKETWNKLRVNKREFRFEGYMYDIKFYNESETVIEVKAYKDHKESGLIKSFSSLIDETSSADNDIDTVLLRILAEKYIGGTDHDPVYTSSGYLIISSCLITPKSHNHLHCIFSPPDMKG